MGLTGRSELPNQLGLAAMIDRDRREPRVYVTRAINHAGRGHSGGHVGPVSLYGKKMIGYQGCSMPERSTRVTNVLRKRQKLADAPPGRRQ